MSTLHPDLEALMPEPVANASKGPVAFFVKWTETGSPLRGSIPLFTADQVREAMQAATERAAKLAEAEAVEETGLGDHVYNLAIKHCAAAIRGTENEGAKGS